MKIKSTNPESLSLQIASESQPAHLEPRSPKLSEIMSVKSLLRQQVGGSKVKSLGPRTSKKNLYRGSMLDESIQVKEMSQNLIVIEEEPRQSKLEYQYQMLKTLPEQISVYFTRLPLSSRTNLRYVEEINLFTNYIKSFDDLAFGQLTYLKYLDLSENMISQIPHESINQHLVSLENLRLNSNQITILPFFKHVKHLQMTDNPLFKISQTFSPNLMTLEIDWIPYLTVKTPESNNSQNSQLTKKFLTSKMGPQNSKMTPLQMLKYQYLNKLNSKPETQQDYYEFETIFKLKASKIPTHYLEQIMTQLLQTAINNEHFFFVEFLLKHFQNLHYNKMNMYNKFVLEDVLHIRNTHFSQFMMKLFKPEKWPYEGAYPFIDNLYISIRYSSVSFVQYLLQLQISNQILNQKKHEIFQFLLTQFRETSDGLSIAGAICSKIFQESDPKNDNHTVKISLTKFPLSKSRIIMNFWNFITRNQKFKPFVLFNKRQKYNENSLLHFAIKSHEPQYSIQLILQTQNKLDLFLKNSLGQTAKCQFAADKLCKRIIWQLQKKYLKQNNNLKHDVQTEFRLLNIEVSNQLQSPYVKMSGIRTKKLKEIIKLLGLECTIMKGIMSNCLQNEYLESEQQVYFLLQQILQKLDKINSQLKLNHKTLSSHQFYVIILKLLQTQIFDKRCYLAGQIGKLISRKKEDKHIKSLEDIANQEVSKEEINWTDNQLLIEYELMHSISLLKTQNLMVSQSTLKASDYQEAPSSMGIFNMARFNCKKCD